MSDTVNARTTPWHLWVVGVVALLWNGFGGYDYLMSHLQGAAYYQQVGMSDAQIAYMAAYPTWMHGVWALGVWGAVAGSVLLLLRSRFALHAFVLSLLGIVGSNGYALFTPGGWALMGGAITAVIAGIGVALLLYAWAMTRRGVLR
jgi:hypothetical protein